MEIEKPQTRDLLPRYTIRDWEQWEGQWELIDGLAWAMSPAPNSRHQELNFELLRAFKDSLKKCKMCKAYLPVNFKLNESTALQPD